MDASATFLSCQVTLLVPFQFTPLDHLVNGRTVERTGPVTIIFELLLVDVDRAGEYVMVVGLAVPGLAHPHGDQHDLRPAEQRGAH